tara:strand:+ start:1674 stop:2243 length:570 start_codon:yes stop_codon:yes gene_type:complete
MDREHPVPWFPAWGVRFQTPVENVFSLVSVVNEWRPSNRWLMVAYDAVASEVHLWTAWYTLRGNEESGSMVAKTPDTEFLRLISGTHQINRAFERAGISEGDERAWIVFLPDSEIGEEFGGFPIPVGFYNDSSKDAKRLVEQLGGSLLPKRPVPSISGLERVGFDTSRELSVSEIEVGFLSHMALSDLR